MAGPTPVSALIHAATMVTSGLYILCRLWPIYAGQAAVLHVVFLVGLATAWLAALIALKQNDIKKVLAYSTVSQLGFMFVAMGAGSPQASFFHVLTHACFKALLFLAAGSVIHGMHEEQNMFAMGNLKSKMKWTHLTFLVGTLAIMGFPLTSGFFSKDMILAEVYSHYGMLGYLALLGAAVLTAFYMFRAYTLTFLGKARSEKASHAHESSPAMTIPLLILAALSLFVGWLEIPAVFGHITFISEWVQGTWYGWLPNSEHTHLHASVEISLMLITTLASLTAAALAIRIYKNIESENKKSSLVNKIFENKFYVDEIYELFVINPLKKVGFTVSRFLDKQMFNGSTQLGWNILRLQGDIFSFFHTGNIQTYAWHFVFWLSLFLGVALVWIL
jgi:NADH-quinone oxidoreductase subunit L